MILAGADPGAEGAVAFMDAETHRILGIVDMPMAGAELMVRDLVMEMVRTLDSRRCGHLFIERQTPYASPDRRIGATSAFHLGQRYMAIKAIAA
jgi:hypothetical protein